MTINNTNINSFEIQKLVALQGIKDALHRFNDDVAFWHTDAYKKMYDKEHRKSYLQQAKIDLSSCKRYNELATISRKWFDLIYKEYDQTFVEIAAEYARQHYRMTQQKALNFYGNKIRTERISGRDLFTETKKYVYLLDLPDGESVKLNFKAQAKANKEELK